MLRHETLFMKDGFPLKRVWRAGVLLVLSLICYGETALAQSADEHEAHHPGQAPSAMSSSATPSPPGMMGGDMGGMMEKMGAPKPRDLYPSLMNLPDLPHEKRHEVKYQAHQRMQEGAAQMGKALDRLAASAKREDFEAMQKAMPELREGVARFDSGLAAHRALSEGRAPRNVALRWFKREMNLVPAAADEPSSQRAMHLSVIAILAIFALLMLGMYFFKMRRAAAVLGSLTAQKSKGSTGTEEGDESVPASNAAPAATEQTASAAGQHPAATLPAIPDPDRPKQEPPEFPVMKSASEPADKWKGRLRVCRIFDEANGVKTFRLAAEDQIALPFTYFPGQFLTLSASIDGKTVRRSYTIASSPTQLHYAAVTVKREDHGVFSRYLHDDVNEGDTLEVAAPNGKFTFTGAESDSIVLIAGGVGITPMMSVIRYLTDIGWHQEIWLLFCCRTTSDFMFREELEQLQERHANLNVVAAMTRADGAIWMGLKGRFTRELIGQLVPEIDKRRVHVCGPPPMMTAVLEMLAQLSVPTSNVHTEAFGPAKRSQPTRSAAEPLDAGAGARRDDGAGARRVAFKKSGKEGAAHSGATILDVADELGVDIENSCRTGQCGMCKVKLLSGAVSMEVDDALSDDEKATNIVLACQAIPTQQVEVDA